MTKNTVQREIVEYRKFSCSILHGFTFKYPVFRNLEAIRTEPINKDGCKLLIGQENDYALIAIQIYRTVLSSMRSDSYRKTFVTLNNSSVPYRLYDYSETQPSDMNKVMIEFFTDDANPNAPFGIIVDVSYLPKEGSVRSFNEDIFFKSIVDTFTLTKQPK